MSNHAESFGSALKVDAADSGAREEQLDFEHFIAELSVQFINLRDDEVKEAIRAGLGRMCERIGLDRSSLYRLDSNGLVFDPVTWTADGIPVPDAAAWQKDRVPRTIERLLQGEVVRFSRLDEIDSEADRGVYEAAGTKSAVIVPLSVGREIAGAVQFDAVATERVWMPATLHRLRVLGSVFEQVLARQLREEALRTTSAEVQRLKDQLQVENVYLRKEERERLGLTRIVGESPAIKRVLEQIQQVAATDATVLLLGETGTGKELFATYIHELGKRHSRAIVRVNCAAIPSTLIESELFGREKGAYTGSLSRQIGRFELANHSTIFLDEIGDLPSEVQVKLLRVLEEKTIERLGSPRPIEVDTRIIAATHRNLEQRIADGSFREDLYYRLNVFPIHVPPLRERPEDIPLLVWRFIEEFSKSFGKRIESIDKATLAGLQQYTWPGNIRELRNVVERAMIVTTSRRLTLAPPLTQTTAPRRSTKLIDVEKDHIRSVLDSTGWRIRGTAGAAARLGLKPTTLETRMAKLGLKRPGRA